MARPFEIHQPGDVAAARALVGRYCDAAAFYAGGTELLLIMKEGLVSHRHLVDLHGSAEYKREMVKVFVRRAFHAGAARFA
jgi:CO/xanthine dehydrogenase FAD-binding subunit